VKQMNGIARTELLKFSLYLVLYTMKEVKGSIWGGWLLKIIIIIIVIILIILTWAALAPVFAAAAAGAGGGAAGVIAGLTAVAVTFKTAILVGLAASLAVFLVAKYVGGTLGLILTVVIAIAAAAITLGASIAAITPQLAVQAILGVVSNIASYVQQEAQFRMADLLEEEKTHEEKVEANNLLIEEGGDLLEMYNEYQDPLMIGSIEATLNSRQTPQEFLDLRLLTGTAQLSLESVYNYTDTLLTLPSTNQ
ncbi:MAG: hypothetical protein DRP64_07905, partial [Verrucomicrobia bacterium]